MKNNYTFILAILLFQIFNLYNAKGQSVSWRYFAGLDIKQSSPAVADDGSIYIGSYDNQLHAVNPDGTLKWAFDTGGDIDSSPSIGQDGTIYVGSKSDSLYAIKPDGTLKWKFPIYGDNIFSNPAQGPNGVVFVGSTSDTLYAINPDGTKKWGFKAAGDIKSSPCVGVDGTVYFNSYEDNLYAVNPDGTQKWAVTLSGRCFGMPIISGSTLFVGVEYKHLVNEGKVYSINATDGTINWEVIIGGRIASAPSLDESGVLYIGTKEDKSLYAINSLTGAINWTYTTGDIVVSTPAIASDGKIYFGSFDDSLHIVNPDGTRFSALNLGGNVFSSPVISDNGMLYVGSYSDSLYAISIDAIGPANSPWPMFGLNKANIASKYDLTTAVEPEDAISTLSCYPNPTNSVIYIKGAEIGSSVDVFNILGMRIISTALSGDLSIDVSNLRKGTYFIKVESIKQPKPISFIKL
ncbi:T9SS type A sorting domain-containing protein [Labilibacter sediminis]|nr:T9SS type A sorting domain-containing protein [Labilibacter sediminis]